MLVLRGKRSDMFASNNVAKVKPANPRVTLVELDAGHDVAGNDPARFLREVRVFLNQQRG